MGLGMGRLEAQDLFATGYRRVEIEFLLVKKALVIRVSGWFRRRASAWR